jgi:hypothetical protein
VNAGAQATYSRTVQATVKGASGFSVVAYPNPVSADNKISVLVRGSVDANALIIMTDATGKEVRRTAATTNLTEIDLTGLSVGAYLIKYSGDSHNAIIKVNKMN